MALYVMSHIFGDAVAVADVFQVEQLSKDGPRWKFVDEPFD